MKPVLFVITAMFFYAIANVVLEQKFARYNNLTLIICYCSIILATAILMRLISKTGTGGYGFPVGTDALWILLVGIAFFFADYFYIAAYTHKGNLYAIVCASMMFPVFASLMKLAWVGALPNLWQIGGYALASGSILLIAKGNSLG